MKSNSPFSPLKILRHPDRLASVTRGDIPVPVTVEVDPTNRCNFNCIWCMYEEFNKSNPETLSEDFLLSLMEDLGDMGVKSVVFTGGGEPLVNVGTLNAMRKAREKEMEVALVTNGEPLSGDALETAVENCAWIRISLDAGMPDTYHRCHGVSGRDAFSTVTDNVRQLVRRRNQLASRVAVGLGFLVHPYNYEEVFTASKLARELGVDYIQFRPVYSYGFDLDDRIVKACTAQIQHAVDQYQSDDFQIFASMERFKPKDREYETCRACRLVGVVAADMHTYVCCQLKGDPRYQTGDLTAASFREIWADLRTHAVCDRVDVGACPPCRYDGCNRILDFLLLENPAHVNFI